MKKKINGDTCHDALIKKTTHSLAFNKNADFERWRKELCEKLCELSGFDKIKENACPPNLEIEEDIMKEGYRRIRFTFESEIGSTVPCYLLIPDTKRESYPLAIMLQGHTTGVDVSIGEPADDRWSSGEFPTRNFFGLQAVKRGYAALCIEQRGMGERATGRHDFWDGGCWFSATRAVILGRTLIAERVWDVSRAIDVMESFPAVDTSNIILAGHSGGGTASFYAACLDERIKIAVSAGAFSNYADSIMDVRHCMCNYIPRAFEYFEMGDLTALIAPRTFISCDGENDPIFPKRGSAAAFKRAVEIYEAAGAGGKCRQVWMPCAHEWREELVWQAIDEEYEKLTASGSAPL